MTVLMRAVRGSAPLAAQMLESEGIPVFCDAGEGYFDIPEIRAMTALLQTIENGARDEPLLAALRGPALGLEESELAQIRIYTPDVKTPYHEAVRRYREEMDDALAEKLAEMEKRRGESRKARAKTGMPVVSLVGYTNVGKSSLMNALCGPSVAEADMLFATLDPTSRKLVLPSGMAVLLVDTVGFVSRLPHNLVEAFKSTLEEAAWSDVIVRVADAGDEQREEQLAVTDEVLDGLDCADIPRLTVYNKCDKPGALSFDPDILLTSAKTGYGLDKLLAKLDETLSDRVHTIRVLLPYDKLGLAAPMRERGSVQLEEYREDGLYLEGIVKTEDLHCFEGYLV